MRQESKWITAKQYALENNKSINAAYSNLRTMCKRNKAIWTIHYTSHSVKPITLFQIL